MGLHSTWQLQQLQSTPQRLALGEFPGWSKTWHIAVFCNRSNSNGMQQLPVQWISVTV
jgi:hypothetical protein